MNIEVKHFLTKLLPYALGLIAIDLLLGIVGGQLVAHLPGNSNKLAQHKYRMTTTTADIILIGPSRCQQHYIPEQLRDSIASYLGNTLSVYNAGIDGTGLCANLCAIESLLDRYTPKVIVIDVQDHEFCSYQDKTVRFLLPFYSSNPHVRDYINAISWKERLLAHSNLYRYNGRHLIEMLQAYRSPIPAGGYYANPGTMDTTHMKPSAQRQGNKSSTDEKEMVHFEHVVNKCAERGVRLIIAVSPIYRPDHSPELTAQICEQYHLPLLDCSNVAYLNRHPELFRDKIHLNYKGAPIYTALFFERFRPYLKQQSPNTTCIMRR